MAFNLRVLEQEMDSIIDTLSNEFSKLRTGRSNASLVEDIQVAYYGTQTPLKQMASISTPDATQIVVQPWDKNALGDIENAIAGSGKGLSAVNDGKSLRIKLPPLTEERRKELTKMVHAQAEEARVALRGARQKMWQTILSEEKQGKATEDDRYRAEKDLNELIKKYNEKIDQLAEGKSKEIETI